MLESKMKHDFKTLIRKTTNGRMKIRLLAISHFHDGRNRTEIANILKVSRSSINKWVSVYLNGGLDALHEKPRTGRPTKLTEQQRKQLQRFVLSKSSESQQDNLQMVDIKEYIQATFGVSYKKSALYNLLNELKPNTTTLRSKKSR